MNKLKTFYKLNSTLSNVKKYIGDYLGLFKGKIIYEFKDGLKLEVEAGTRERNLINEIWVHENYTKNFDLY